MTTYRIEVAEDVEGTPSIDGMVAVTVQGFRVRLPLGLLTEVKAPLPPEPPVGAVVRADFKAPDLDETEAWVFEHTDHPAPNGNSWFGAGRDEAFSWAEICALGTPVLLVPAPVPVEMPWASQRYEVGIMRTTVNATSDGVVDANSNGHTGVAVVMPPEQAREKARALNAAADQAEATS